MSATPTARVPLSSADEQPSRYVVGVDLGTSNSAVAFVDTSAEPWRVETFAVPQLVAPGVVERRETFPSCHYQQAAGEFAAGALRLPWSRADPDFAVGFFARDQGAAAPGRLIASAKSWLCHAGVDRLAPLLPWHGAPDVEKLSPVAASSRYLAHIRAAWNHAHPADPLEGQDLALTLPASFDEVARELTVRAAAEAGLPRVVLIEEPQAAFYAWIHAQGEAWDQQVRPGEKILVCDVGGGTSDFTLIHARQGSSGKVQFQRMAVGDHLILGGDNFDLALAQHVEQRLAADGRKLEPRQWAVLARVCRQVKESLLGDEPPERYTISLPGGGARLIGGALQIDVARDEIQRMLLDGFFPLVALDDKPQTRRSGFQEFGLPYAADPAITRYLAAFLTAHRDGVASAVDNAGAVVDANNRMAAANSPPRSGSPPDVDPARPDVVLFNGGVFASPMLRERLMAALSAWFGKQTGWRPRLLANARLDLAVAEGAAYYGMVRRGAGVRIAAGLARAYYVGVAADADPIAPQTSVAGVNDVPRVPLAPPAPPPLAVCLAPAGVEEGQTIDLSSRRFRLKIREPVEFPLYVSSTRLTDKPGDVIAVDPDQLTALPPIRTVLETRKKLAPAETAEVELHARVTEIGTLELWCSATGGAGSWRLQFDVRAATRTDLTGHRGLAERAGVVDVSTLETARRLIAEAFPLAASAASASVEGLVKRLAAALETPRSAWPPSLLREMWEALVDREEARRRSPVAEARWLNLLGFALRPGYGLALDDWRVAQTWRTLGGRLFHAQPMCRAEWWILWRRIAGGLPAGQQRALADPLIAEIRATTRALAKGRGADARTAPHEAAEIWRLLGSLELLPAADKVELGAGLLQLAAREKTAALAAAGVWAIGRTGARTPLYGPLNAVVPIETAVDWVETLLNFKRPPETLPLALMQLARRTGDRYRDLPEKIRERVLGRLETEGAPPHFVELVSAGGELAEDEQGLVFGDSLPRGLSIA